MRHGYFNNCKSRLHFIELRRHFLHCNFWLLLKVYQHRYQILHIKKKQKGSNNEVGNRNMHADVLSVSDLYANFPTVFGIGIVIWSFKRTQSSWLWSELIIFRAVFFLGVLQNIEWIHWRFPFVWKYKECTKTQTKGMSLSSFQFFLELYSQTILGWINKSKKSGRLFLYEEFAFLLLVLKDQLFLCGIYTWWTMSRKMKDIKK